MHSSSPIPSVLQMVKEGPGERMRCAPTQVRGASSHGHSFAHLQLIVHFHLMEVESTCNPGLQDAGDTSRRIRIIRPNVSSRQKLPRTSEDIWHPVPLSNLPELRPKTADLSALTVHLEMPQPSR